MRFYFLGHGSFDFLYYMFKYRTFNPVNQLIHTEAYKGKISKIIQLYQQSLGNNVSATHQNFVQYLSTAVLNPSDNKELLLLLISVRPNKSVGKYEALVSFDKNDFKTKLKLWDAEATVGSENYMKAKELLNDESTWSSILGLEISGSEVGSPNLEELDVADLPSELLQEKITCVIEEEGLSS